MLAATLGPNKATVKVNADLNVDETTEKELTYAAKGTPLKTDRRRPRSSRAARPTAGGTAGTGANVPTYSAGAAGGGANSNYHRKKTETDFGVNKKVTETKIATGAVNKLDVALLVDKSVPAPVFESLQQTVAAAAGIDTRAATRSPRRRWPSPRPRCPRRARCRRRCSARSSGSASASRRCCSCSSWSAG